MQGERPETSRRSAAELLVKKAAPTVDPTATMRGVLEQLAGRCADKLDDLAPVPMELAFADSGPGTMEEVATGWGEAGVVATFQTADERIALRIGAAGDFVSLVTEAVFGSDGSEPAGDATRAPTSLELRLVGAIFTEVVEELRIALLGADAPPLVMARLESTEKPVADGQPGGASTLARFRVSAFDRTAEMCVVLPAAKEGSRSQPSAPGGSPAALDTRWSQRFEKEVQRTQVTLTALLDERELTLDDVAGLHVGQVLPLKATPRSNLRVACNDQTMFWCELGQADGVYTLRIKDFPSEEQELIDAITSQ